MNYDDLEYLQLINQEFDFLNIASIKSNKCQNKTTYKALYFNIKERYQILNECQELCVDLEPMDIYPVLKCRVQSNLFLKNLYATRDQLVKKSFIAKTKKVLDYIKSDNFTKYKRKSLTALAKELRLSPYFFTHMKRLCKQKFDLIMSFDKDPYKSVYLFKQEMLNIMNKCAEFCKHNESKSSEIFLKDKQHIKYGNARYLRFLQSLNTKEPLLLQYRQIKSILNFYKGI